MATVVNYNNEEELMRRPKRAYTPLLETYDTLSDTLVNKGIIKLPHIKKHIFQNVVLKYCRFLQLSQKYKTSQKIIINSRTLYKI